MAGVLDFQKICRACLLDTGSMKDLFMVCTPEIFKYCTSVEVAEDDNLPRQICEACLEVLNKSYYFKQASVRSNLILRQQLLNDQPPVKAVKVENPSNEHEILEIDVTEITDNMLSQNMMTDDEILPDRSMEPAEIIRRIRKRKVSNKPMKNRTRMKCPKCNRSFQKYENFEAHLRSHFGKKPDIKCEHCDKTFPTLRNLHSHIRTHTGSHLDTHSNQKNYICAQCGKKFAQPGNLKIHLMRHTGIKNVACQLCDMRFYVRGDLLKHMRSHSEEKPYSCEYCDKTFKTKSFKVVHMRTHTGERPYACDLCPKTFMARKDMRNHRMIHTGEKPHKCQVCDQAFIQKCALNRHMKGHMQKGGDKTQDILLRGRLQGSAEEYTPWHTDV